MRTFPWALALLVYAPACILHALLWFHDWFRYKSTKSAREVSLRFLACFGRLSLLFHGGAFPWLARHAYNWSCYSDSIKTPHRIAFGRSVWRFLAAGMFLRFLFCLTLGTLRSSLLTPTWRSCSGPPNTFSSYMWSTCCPSCCAASNTSTHAISCTEVRVGNIPRLCVILHGQKGGRESVYSIARAPTTDAAARRR